MEEEAEDNWKTYKEIRDKEANVFLHYNWAHNSQYYQITLPSHRVIHVFSPHEIKTKFSLHILHCSMMHSAHIYTKWTLKDTCSIKG